MRIAQIAPLIESVPPVGYGGTELIVSLLTDGLVRAGHRVTLFASGDSRTAARLRSVIPRNLRCAGLGGALKGPNVHIYHLLNAVACFEEAADFDLIHNHAWVETMIVAALVRTPLLTTLHNLVDEHAARAWDVYPGSYNTTSWSAYCHLPATLRQDPRSRFAGFVHHGIDYRSFPFSPRGQGYLLTLNRICPEKGTHEAIAAARRLGRPLVIAGKVDDGDTEYFHSRVEPYVDGQHVRYVGEADAEAKRLLYAGADCLLNPIRWPEPFGLVMIEAMACGTPVVAFDYGAVPEIVAHGRTGFVVRDVDEMVAAVRRVEEIDRRACRRHVEVAFSHERMVADYLDLYEKILGQAKRSAA
ncbi:MAG: glycosyltransferase family 4 protein [Chloroflexi bacterium]|nr:glycosyltransferase family 4 protein [Chloroflexota bacterium]